ncbi:bifunctional chorismate mutase/prephenate dehydrogenase [Thorsellia kenyensis]|uniref:T-protein n=1 Tax=Thorsellia kenyensis TaxID=1549888 RepID=A0ABV6C9N7_9GAMM
MAINELSDLRQQIDSIDRALLDLLHSRLALVEQVGEVKSLHGLPIYDPTREKSMLTKRRAEAESLGISGDLIEDILRRIMRESYTSENDKGFKKLNQSLGDIVIIGGYGQMGQLYAKLFRLSGYQVVLFGTNDWQDDIKVNALKNAGLVVISVPISQTIEVIEKLPILKEECILCDLTSIKQKPLDVMMKKHTGPVVGLHPMFGPDVVSLAKQVIALTKGRHEKAYNWLIEQFKIWGAHIVETTPEEHDECMQLIQALRHFTTFVYGLNLSKQKANLNTLLNLSSPIYRLELIMVGRLFAQDPTLYADIIMSSDKNIETIDKFYQIFSEALVMIKNKDKYSFVQEFNQISQWFSDHADQFLIESRNLLKQASDSRS